MRTYDYSGKWEKLLTPKIVSMLTQIHEYKGEQALFIESKGFASKIYSIGWIGGK